MATNESELQHVFYASKRFPNTQMKVALIELVLTTDETTAEGCYMAERS